MWGVMFQLFLRIHSVLFLVSSSASTPQFGFGSKAATTTSTTSFTPILGTTTTPSGIYLNDLNMNNLRIS